MLNEYSWIDQHLTDLRNEAAQARLASRTRRSRVGQRRRGPSRHAR
ncbi:MAG TPA: hypothetical protein VHC49_15725 [Mycobacteriales bacterium]|nr:hypothetical protein [Mycobacteriales bacterium]